MKELEIESEFLSAKEVAKRLRVNIITVRKLIDKKELNSYKIGSRFRIKISDIEQYLNKIKTINNI
jgi:putative molybdopterin biosynthesis protein